MKILLDTANLAEIEEIIQYYPIDGFTTNPTILSRDSSDVPATLRRLMEISGGKMEIHVQVTAAESEGMLAQAKALDKFVGKGFHIKIPVTPEGIRAMTLCKKAGIRVTATSIFTPMQALLAAKAGADYVAPYVNSIDNMQCDGPGVVSEILTLFENFGYPTKMLAAGFDSVSQVLGVALAGAHTVTVTASIMHKLLFHPHTDLAVGNFAADWKAKFGAQSVSDLLK
ncbi:transaldolase family protein [Zongyangia hominis]|uniref:Fructose-6-phosphate aldolase n=1 Tax=Zongyangia hominis TaxID=2763677 RepID=A0A926EAW2_9FIRM|nr:transaldolase family protein [Zongyangia hominis]MBC8571145.1 hypothetical protein [Zongyangia hominis]